jgi:thioredoxin 1
MVPVLEQIARECAATLRVGAVRLDDAPDLASRFEIMSRPTLIVFSEGVPRKRLTEAAGKDRILDEFREFLCD